MNLLTHEYGRTMGKKKVALAFSRKAPLIKTQTRTLKISDTLSPVITSQVVKTMGTDATKSMLKNINQGTFNPDEGIEQFSALEQSVLNEAIASGDYTSLTPKLKAFLDYQVAQKQASILEAQEAELALSQQATATAETQAVQAQELEQAKASQKKKQTLLYVGVGALGLGLIYYMSTK